MTSPTHIPLPLSPIPLPRLSSDQPLSPPISPRTLIRPHLERTTTGATIRQSTSNRTDSFYESSTVSVNQPVGSLSISPSSRDVCLASRKGLYILDLANLNNAPRFIPQGGTWQIADCQWSPHPATSNLILSTSSQKLLVWDLSAGKCLSKSIDAHARAITDINWHARNPNLMATVAMDAGIRGWDLRACDRPFIRLCAWTAAGTQVKWNRQHEHLLATAHGKEVIIWDDRKGSVPVVRIRAHDAKIYGIDWDREHRHKLVTCSLDKTIKFWTVPELGPSLVDSNVEFYSSVAAPDTPTHTVSTCYPVWRARNLPFGHGVLALPQRGQNTLDMYGTQSDTVPVETFAGHDDVVKEFVWRVRGGDDELFDDREFQLVTWSKDRTLRIWPVGRDITEKVGFKYGAPIKVIQSRKGAADITYTRAPNAEGKKHLPPPIVNPSGISRQKLPKAETGMTRGGGTKTKGMDQLEWLTKVVKNPKDRASPDSSSVPSRAVSMTRMGSRGTSADGKVDKGEFISLKDEVVLVNKIFPRPRINFERIDLAHRKLTMSMNGPWANGNRMAFMRIHWSFSSTYPWTPDIPTFELERNPTISPITRQKIVATLKEMRAASRQCLVATSAFLLGSNERMGRRLLEEESDSESEKDVQLSHAPMLIPTCGATFGPNGQLVCFFPKQTVLPRTRQISRSPSVPRDAQNNPLFKAMSALSRLENPRHRNAIRFKPRMRRFENLLAPVQAGSTMTIHDVSHLGNPDVNLAQSYGVSLSPEINLQHAFDAKRLDHAEVWSTLRSLLSDPPPPPYSAHHDLVAEAEARREKEVWERGTARKKLVLDEIFSTLIASRDVQLLALVACCILHHVNRNPPPPILGSPAHRSPVQDYFALPKTNTYPYALVTPARKVSRSSIIPLSPGPSSFRTSGWSQVLNPSSISLRINSAVTQRSAMTPTHRQSFDLTPRTKELEDSPIIGSIPVPEQKNESPRYRDRQRVSGIASASPTAMTPLRSGISLRSGTMPSIDDVKPFSDPALQARQIGPTGSKVTFGSASPLRRNYSRAALSAADRRKATRVCGVRIDMPTESTDPPSLLDGPTRAMCEGFKLAYADFLLRSGLLGVRAKLLQFRFLEDKQISGNAVKAAEGTLTLSARQRLPSLATNVHVCIACATSADKCVSCRQTPVKPLCTYCRLPIRGLAATCTLCAHRSHAKCFILSSVRTSCPSCMCHCVQDGGVTGPSLLLPMPAPLAPPPTITRGFARGSISPLSPERAVKQSHAPLKTIRENEHAANVADALGFLSDTHDGSGNSGWLPWDPARLGWGAGGHDEQGEGEQKEREGTRGDGLLARTRERFRGEGRGRE